MSTLALQHAHRVLRSAHPCPYLLLLTSMLSTSASQAMDSPGDATATAPAAMSWPGWSDMLPPKELADFLRGIKLQQYDVLLAELGYDDVDDFANFDEAVRTRLRTALEGKKIPGGHVDKILRAVAASAASLHQSQPEQQQLPPSAFTSFAATSAAAGHTAPILPSPTAPETAGGIGQAALHMSASGTIQLAANAAGEIAVQKRQEAHIAKVHTFIEQRTKLHPDAPRILYGRDHSNTIKPIEVRMNAEALTLLSANPNLLSFGNGRIQTQALIEAARTAAYAGGYSLAKGFSKSTGAAGQLAPRPVSKAALMSPGVSAHNMVHCRPYGQCSMFRQQIKMTLTRCGSPLSCAARS